MLVVVSQQIGCLAIAQKYQVTVVKNVVLEIQKFRLQNPKIPTHTD